MNLPRFGVASAAVAALVLTAASRGIAQQSAAPAAPALNFSGVIYANFQYRTDAALRNFNKFEVERAYLTFRMPAGEKVNIRVTTDVFQQQNAANAGFYGGWVARIKYAYVQYDYLKTTNWSANARFGVLHTVVVDYEEQFWPRWIAQTALERAGYFSSADGGLATTVTLPKKWGEVYATITNGVGYANRETDRFKDYAVRLSLTPLANNKNELWRSFSITPWALTGATADRIAGVGSGLKRDRYGIFAGLRDPRLNIGAEYAQNTEGGESGTTPATRLVADSSGRVVSGFIYTKPWTLKKAHALQPLGAVVRLDEVTPRTDAPDLPPWPAPYHLFIGGLTWDFSARATLSFDYQEQLPNGPGVATNPTKTWFAHIVANF
jgi:hypothetical protein